MTTIRFVDLFCGVGGFRVAAKQALAQAGLNGECVFSSDIDDHCRRAYGANFGEEPFGDIADKDADSVPDHDLLLAGFPCQPFSVIGRMEGFEDARGTLFFDIARILDAKKPLAFALENVKTLAGHDRGRTLKRIMETLRQLGYHAAYRILNALEFGLPQKRERVFIVGSRKPIGVKWPVGGEAMTPLADILEKEVPAEFYASERIRRKRLGKHPPTSEPTIWHENKSGHVSAYPFSCALRAGASHNYLLVNGERRLMPREMFRLQGFPDSFKIVCSPHQSRRQAGNSLPVPVARQVVLALLESLALCRTGNRSEKTTG